MALSTADYSALTSNIYHFDDADQQIQLGDLKKGLLSVDLSTALNSEQQAPLTAAGFTFAGDGFVYTPRGMGARVVVDGAGNFTIVYRGTDAGSVSFPDPITTMPPLALHPDCFVMPAKAGTHARLRRNTESRRGSPPSRG